jgi:hypothetical protein
VYGIARMKKDPTIEHRIQEEIVVDAHDEQERHRAWRCYMAEHLTFPFSARCVVGRPESPLKVGEHVTVTGFLEADEPEEILVNIRWHDHTPEVPLAQLQGVGVAPATAQAIADWHYWWQHGYRF